MAHIKTGGTTKGNRDSRGKRLGVKLYGGQTAKAGSVLIRQKGTRVKPGKGTAIGKDFTIFSLTQGIVKFSLHQGKKFITVEG